MKIQNKLSGNENAITLIALIITIIILLILAGVSIGMLTGENGILTQANQAKVQNKNKTSEEKIKIAVTGASMMEEGKIDLSVNKIEQELEKQFGEGKTIVRENFDGSFEIEISNENKVYMVMNDKSIKEGKKWEEIMKNAKIPEEQTNKNVIGIGTNGETVNMDFWKFGYDVVTNGYGLNSEEVLQNTEYNKNGENTETIRTAGYIGKETDFRNIIIPQYISEDGGKNYKPVTSLYRTFLNNINITSTPEIPTTVTNLFCAFEGCSKLREIRMPTSVDDIRYAFAGTAIEKIDEFNNNLVNMRGAFSYCNSLMRITGNIPKGVTDLTRTFAECINLKEASIGLPEGLINMDMTFYRCENLEKGPDVIPETVKIMKQTFQKCLKLHGRMTIKSSLTSYGNVFGENCASKAKDKLIIREGNGNRDILEKIIEQSYIEGNYNIVGEWNIK